MIDWKDKNVLICGGAGMIGSHMAKELVGRKAEVTVVDDLSSGSRKNIEGISMKEFIKADLRDFAICDKVTRDKDYVFQFAADMGGIGYITAIGADIMQHSGLINMNMIRAAHKNNIKRYFYSSSACVYPEYKQTEENVKPLAEDDAYPAMPDQFYGWEKLFTEKLCEAYQKDYKMDIRVARFHNIFGEVYTAFDKNKGKAPCHLIMKVLKCPDGSSIDVWGDGKQTRSFLYIDDCIKGVLKLMDSDFMKPINIGSDRLVTIDELANIIINISGKKISINHDPSKPQGVRGRNADLTLVKKVLSWEPGFTLDEGLKNTYEWAVNHFSELENI